MVRLHTVGIRLLAVILAVALPLAAAMAYFWWEALQQGRVREVALLQTKAAQIQRDLEDLRAQAEWVLSRMARRPAFRGLSPVACDDEMAVMREVNPALLLVTLWTKSGDLVCSSIPPKPDQPRPQPHRKSFDEGIATDGLYLSNVFQGQITGLPLVTFTYPVKNAADETVGLLSIPVRMEFFATLLRSVDRRAGSIAGITDRALVLVARHPDNEQWLGKSVAEVVGPAATVRDAGSAFVTAGIDGRERIFVRGVLPAIGWQVFVGAEEQVLFADSRNRLFRGIAVFAFVIAFSLGLAYLIVRGITRPMRHLVSVTDAVAKGDRSVRAVAPGGGEIALLADHVNRMLDTLERSESSLRASMARSRELSGRLLIAEEAERKRIAHDLHDQLGQELTALKIRIETIARTTESQATRAELLEVAAAAGDALQRVRQMSVDLRPPQLDSLGLSATLRAHAQRLSSLGKVEVHFDSRGFHGKVPGEAEIMCFRVAQEALTNVMRHSGAENAWVELGMAEGALRLSVRDDGVGFDAVQALERAGSGGGFGLLGMMERMALAGGTLDIRSRPGQGCIVTATFPVSEAVAGT